VRLLVLGASGQLGGDFADVARQSGHTVTAVSHAACDITDAAAVDRSIAASRAEVVVNCAAWTRVDAAEDAETEAELVNATGAGIVAAACAAAGARICHISTDYVFDGRATEPIDEDAPAAPTSAYGRTKLHGEIAVRERCPDHLVVRTGWLYGRGGPNFVLTILRLAAEHPEVRVVADQQGTPTWTGHLAPVLLRLLEIAPTGTYHLTNSGVTTWHGLAAEALHARGITARVTAITTAEYPTRAARPA
jgi:dTDP-4-dehydrorhamnose reductase